MSDSDRPTPNASEREVARLQRQLDQERRLRLDAERALRERTRAVDRLRRAYDDLAQVNKELTSEITERSRVQAHVEQHTFYDPLCELPNRALFTDRLEHALKRGDRTHQLVGVLLLNLDNLKVVNESLGHDAGDRLLILLAQRLQRYVRAGDTVARFGGDEFAMLLENITEAAEAMAVAERVQEMLREPITLEGTDVVPAFSIGVASGVPHRDRPEQLLRKADIALYRAKALGKARIEAFDESMNADVKDRFTLEADLRHAVARGELCLFYQPIVDLSSGRVGEVEALVRWNHPTRGMVSPVQFIPIAEDTGLIISIGQWVLAEACRQARVWHTEFGADAPRLMSVNLSARQFQSPTLVDDVRVALTSTGLGAEALNLELTETAFMDVMNSAINTMHLLRGIGVELAIDDFGTGYSSLNYLKRFPVNTVKIDRAFVDGLGVEASDTAIVRGILILAHSLKLSTTAEGIETAHQLETLIDLGCDHGQGFHMARPLPPAEVSGLFGQTLIPGLPRRSRLRDSVA